MMSLIGKLALGLVIGGVGAMSVYEGGKDVSEAVDGMVDKAVDYMENRKAMKEIAELEKMEMMEEMEEEV